MRQALAVFMLTMSFSASLIAGEGVIDMRSAHSVTKSANRLESILTGKGMTVFARIDHAAGAKKAGKSIPPTQLLIFGNPKVGTPLMLCSRSIAIDLPQKALVWEDLQGAVWISYNDPKFLKLRHGTEGCGRVSDKVNMALGKFVSMAAAE